MAREVVSFVSPSLESPHLPACLSCQEWTSCASARRDSCMVYVHCRDRQRHIGLPGVSAVHEACFAQIANFLLTILYGRNEVPLPNTLEPRFLHIPRPQRDPYDEVAMEVHSWSSSAGGVARGSDLAGVEGDVPGEPSDASPASGRDTILRQRRREVTLEPDAAAVQQLLANGGGLLVDSNMRKLSLVLGWITAEEGRDLEKTKKALERYEAS